MNNNTLNSTLDLIKNAHKGQIDKSGEAYWKHPVAVMNLLPSMSQFDVKMAALLHDVVEDTHWTLLHLQDMGYSKVTLDIVSLVTRDKRDGLTYQEWIDSIIESGNIGAMMVKLADNKHNMDPNRAYKISDSQMKKYQKSAAKLEKALAIAEVLVEAMKNAQR